MVNRTEVFWQEIIALTDQIEILNKNHAWEDITVIEQQRFRALHDFFQSLAPNELHIWQDKLELLLEKNKKFETLYLDEMNNFKNEIKKLNKGKQVRKMYNKTLLVYKDVE